MTRKMFIAAATLATGLMVAQKALAHCQVPCGIYGDETRFTMMLEHVTTIEKSMKQIEALSGDMKANANQVVRWVQNKDKHADELSEIVTYYFMAQRVKPVTESGTAAEKEYTQKLTLLHQILVQAMKAKQTTDLTHCAELRRLIGEFQHVYNHEH